MKLKIDNRSDLKIQIRIALKERTLMFYYACHFDLH
jgi:hypothetical protein